MSYLALAKTPDTMIPTAAPVTNADKARALIAMLEKKEGAADVPPERLRDWARDLIRTVERETAKPAEAPVVRRRLFTKAPPKLTPPPVARATAENTPSRLTLTAPMPHTPATPARSTPSIGQGVHAPEDVRKILDATLDPAALSREHPAIIAMTLLGKPSLEQASALRTLPGGQVRAVHKALRQLEFNTPRTPAQPSAAPGRATAVSA